MSRIFDDFADIERAGGVSGADLELRRLARFFVNVYALPD
jgi:hypothetical protein